MRIPLFLLAGGLALATACTDVDLDDTASTASDVQSLAGQYSRTLIVDDFLYGVDDTDIITYDITDRAEPVLVDRTGVGLAVETIYHHEGDLFIGSRSGMYIYSISRNGTPVRRGDYQYSDLPGLEVEPCDPVVAEGNTAYASLYTSDIASDPCGRTQEFQTIVVLDIENRDAPTLVQTHDTPSPRGMAIDGDLLFVCNNHNGLTVFDVSDRANFVALDHVDGLNAWDAIANDGRLVVVGATAVKQYDYSDSSDLVLLSSTDYEN